MNSLQNLLQGSFLTLLAMPSCSFCVGLQARDATQYLLGQSITHYKVPFASLFTESRLAMPLDSIVFSFFF